MGGRVFGGGLWSGACAAAMLVGQAAAQSGPTDTFHDTSLKIQVVTTQTA